MEFHKSINTRPSPTATPPPPVNFSNIFWEQHWGLPLGKLIFKPKLKMNAGKKINSFRQILDLKKEKL